MPGPQPTSVDPSQNGSAPANGGAGASADVTEAEALRPHAEDAFAGERRRSAAQDERPRPARWSCRRGPSR
ncbi:hypothetical protein SVIOM74S_00285 [Streptomyces violarus]